MQPYADALERALGGIVAKAQTELALIRAQTETAVSSAAARIAQAEAKLASISAQISERLAAIPDPTPGADGKDGQPGLDGANGLDGKDGAPGESGADGKDGVDGAPGRDGVDGVPGKDGLDGPPGRDGTDGRDGEDGKDGERGAEGPAGKLPLVRGWEEGVHYESEVITHKGATYQALRDTAKEPPHDDWVCLAAAGVNGADGRTFRIRGTYAEGGDYLALDVVSLNGGAFAARKDDPGSCPGEGWQLIASQGKRGQPGERGLPGAKGDRGESGLPVVDVRVDNEGMLTLTNGDGTQVRCDLYPLLTRIAVATPR